MAITNIVQQKKEAAVAALAEKATKSDTLFAGDVSQQYANTLQQLAIAYWGRPLTPKERQDGIALLKSNGGNTQPIIDYLRSSPEFYAYYAAADLLTAIDRAYRSLFQREPTASEIATHLAQPDPTLIPAQLIAAPTPADRQLLALKVLAAEEITQNYDALLSAANQNTLKLHQAARQALGQLSPGAQLGDLIPGIKKILENEVPTLAARLALASDSPPVGDNTTTQGSVTLEVRNIAPGALVWLDKDGDGKFSSGDIPVTITDSATGFGAVIVSLQPGANSFTFLQTVEGKTSLPAYLTITHQGALTTPPQAPAVALRAADDDGVPGDGITSKTLVQLIVTQLDPNRTIAWVDRNGNASFDLATDIAIRDGGAVQNVWVPLQEGVNGFQIYQSRDGLTSPPATLSIYRIKSTDVIKPGETAAYAGSTISLEFDRPIDWRRLDTDNDGKLAIRNLNDPADSGELQVAWGASGTNPPQINNSELSAAVIDPIPAYGSRHLTISGVSITATNRDEPLDGELTLILVGVPDVQGGVTSNVVFTIS